MKTIVKTLFIFFITVSILSCKSKQIVSFNPIKDIPKDIKHRYNPDLVSSEKTALGIAKMIIKEQYENIDIDSLVLEKSTLVADQKVWEIVLKTPKAGFGLIFNIRINKNTGEILNYWEVK